MKMYQQQLGSKKLLWEKQENNVAPLSLPRLLDFPVREIEKRGSLIAKKKESDFSCTSWTVMDTHLA